MDIGERISRKSYDLFLKYGVRSITMDEIASQLGISKKTIYQFYKDKDALVSGVVDIVIEENIKECCGHREKSENPVHEIFIATEMLQEMLNTMNPILMYDLQKYHPASYKKIEHHKKSFLFGLIQENLEQGVAAGLYRSGLNTEIISQFRLASMFMMFNADFYPGGRHHLAKIADEITLHFLYGITTVKGQKLIQKYLIRRNNKSK